MTLYDVLPVLEGNLQVLVKFQGRMGLFEVSEYEFEKYSDYRVHSIEAVDIDDEAFTRVIIK